MDSGTRQVTSVIKRVVLSNRGQWRKGYIPCKSDQMRTKSLPSTTSYLQKLRITMTWLPYDYPSEQDDFFSWIMALVLLLTLVSCQEPVNMRAKKVLIPLEVIAVLAALKTKQIPFQPPETCLDDVTPQSILSNLIIPRMSALPLDNGELPPISKWT